MLRTFRAAVILLIFLAFPLPAQNFLPPSALLYPYLAQAPEIISHSAALIDAATGTLLYAKNPDDEIPPASLTKLMTMHIVLNEAAAGRVSLDDNVPLAREAWAINQPPRSSLMFLGPGQTVSLREIMLGLAVPSGNDAAVAAALAVAPTVRDFVSMMNSEARRFGLLKTYFTEPSGISENNMTTAGEAAAFCRIYLALHPESLAEYHSVREFSYPQADNVAEAFRNRPQTITQANRNSLLRSFPGVDGLKTGYIDEAGYNIALTAERQGSRFILAILGAPAEPGGDRVRDDDGRRLLSWAFENFKTVYPAAGDIESPRLWKGREKTAELKMAHNDPLLAESAAFTAPRDRADRLWITTEIKNPLIAPLPSGFPAGWLVISDEEGELHRVALITAKTYGKGNILRRIWDSIRLLFYKPR
jgi:D-alanyl-D-alanine carboxypeptidase (penicillin-binding protein 5/6)